MTMADFFSHYWWLMFPIFGMGMGVLGMLSSERRANAALKAIKAYVDQGKEPPPELLKLAASGGDTSGAQTPSSQQQSSGWTFIVFAAMAAGFGTGYYLVRAEDFAFAFLIVAIVMGVMALGALVMLLIGRRG
jgi:hypothetical protein